MAWNKAEANAAEDSMAGYIEEAIRDLHPKSRLRVVTSHNYGVDFRVMMFWHGWRTIGYGEHKNDLFDKTWERLLNAEYQLRNYTTGCIFAHNHKRNGSLSLSAITFRPVRFITGSGSRYLPTNREKPYYRVFGSKDGSTSTTPIDLQGIAQLLVRKGDGLQLRLERREKGCR